MPISLSLSETTKFFIIETILFIPLRDVQSWELLLTLFKNLSNFSFNVAIFKTALLKMFATSTSLLIND